MKNKKRVSLPPYKVKKVLSTLSQVQGWGITQLNVPETWKITEGENVYVMVIDTGYTDHHDLEDAVLKDKCKSYVDGESFIEDKNGHSCITPDTKIFTNYCGLERIDILFDRISSKNILIDNDSVVKDVSNEGLETISHFNNNFSCQPIEAVHKIKYKGELLRIKYGANKKFPLDIAVTPWHPLYVCTSRGEYFNVKKINADQIKTGDNLIRNDTCITPSQEYRYVEYEGEKICLNEDLAWLLGVIITDGNIWNGSNCQYRIDIDQCNENIDVLIKFKNICNNLGINCLEHKFVNKSKLYFSNKKWWTIISALVSKENNGKRIKLPQLITKSPLKVCMSFIAGLIDGDGYVSKTDGRIKVVTSCKDFAESLRLFLVTLGLPSVSIIFNKARPNSFSKTGCEMWQVKFKDSTGLLAQFISINRKRQALSKGKIKTHRVYKVLDIQKESYDGYLYDFTVKNSNNYIANGIIASNTHCTGIIAARNNDIGMVGVAPKCNIINVKVLGEDGTGDFDAIKNALKYAKKIKPHLISMSLGAPEDDPELHQLVKDLYKMDIPIIAAAGNDGRSNSVNYPGRYPEVICVSAYDKKGHPAGFNSTGPEVGFSAPGVNIYSTWLNQKYATLSGTCTIGDTIIYTNKGPKKIKDIKIGDIVYSLNESLLDIQQNKVVANICNGIKQTYKLQTNHNTIYATSNHPFLVYDKVIKSRGIRNRYGRELKWKELKDLSKNDLICVTKNIHTTGNIDKINKLFLDVCNKYIKNRRDNLKMINIPNITPEFCQFIGAYLGDGYLLHNKNRSAGIGLCIRCGYNQLNKKMPDYYNDIFKKVTGLKMTRDSNDDLYIYSSYMAEFFENIGLGGNCHEKRLPEWIYELPIEYKEALISGIIDSDGWISKRGDFGLQLCNKALLIDIKCLLDMMGVKCSNIKTRKTMGHNFNRLNVKEYTSYYLTSTKIKNIKLNLQDVTYNQRLNKKHIFEKHNYDYCSNDEKYIRDQNIKLEKIRSITPDDFKEVYDLTIENNHNYIAEGIIIHNSMATPFMSGLVALLIAKHIKQELVTGQNDCKTVDQIKEHLLKYADRKGVSGHDENWGYGVINPVNLINEVDTENTPVVTAPPAKLTIWSKIKNWFRGLFR